LRFGWEIYFKFRVFSINYFFIGLWLIFQTKVFLLFINNSFLYHSKRPQHFLFHEWRYLTRFIFRQIFLLDSLALFLEFILFALIILVSPGVLFTINCSAIIVSASYPLQEPNISPEVWRFDCLVSMLLTPSLWSP
jgi:hypothetical protein